MTKPQTEVETCWSALLVMKVEAEILHNLCFCLRSRHRSSSHAPVSLSPKVLSVVEVPCRRVAHHLASIRRLLQHGFVPELLWHRQQTQRGEEIVRFLEHSGGVPALNGGTRATVMM